MFKLKLIIGLLFIPLFIMCALILWRVIQKQDYARRVIVAQETRQVIDHVMTDLRGAKLTDVLSVPADGQWHQQLTFDHWQLGRIEYVLTKNVLTRHQGGKSTLIAHHIESMLIRRHQANADVLEVQLKTKLHRTLVSNFKVKLRG